MNVSGGSSMTGWLLLVVVFGLTLLGIFWVVSLWRQRLGPQARIMRDRMARLLGGDVGAGGSELLLKVQPERQPGLVESLPGMEQLTQLLKRTQSSQTASAFLVMVLVLMAGAGVVFGVLLQLKWQATLALALFVGALPWLRHVRKDRRQRRLFEEMFPDALDYLARALRSGQGLSSGLALVGQEFSDPIGREFKTTVDEINYGLGFAEAMNHLAERVRSPDLDFFVVGIIIQRETGGNLAELLEGLSSTVRERIKLAGKVRVLSAEGRLSGIVLGGLPFILGGLLSVLNPEYMNMLWKTEAGMRMIGIGLFMIALGGLWIWKIVRVRV
jgi:tight adherence protein B